MSNLPSILTLGEGIKLNRFLRYAYNHLKIVWLIWNHKQILQRMWKAKIYNIKAQKLLSEWKKKIKKTEANKATFFCPQTMKKVLFTTHFCMGDGGGIKLNRFLRYVYNHLKIVWMIWNHKHILQRTWKAKIYNIKAQKL